MQSKQPGEYMSGLGILRSSNPTSAEAIAAHLDDATIQDIRHIRDARYLGSTAYADMLDVIDAVRRSVKGFTLVGLFKVTQTLRGVEEGRDVEEGSVILLHRNDSPQAKADYSTFSMTVDAGEIAVTYDYPNSSGYIADKLVAAEGLSRLLQGFQTDPQLHLGTIPRYPDNHVA